jgi:hypothetical protein
MSLVFDDRLRLEGMPAMHALIVGVGDLPHTEGGYGLPRAETFGIAGVAGASVSAREIYRWLMNGRHLLRLPLATVRVLISPQRADGFDDLKRAMSPTLDSFLDALYEWRADASTNSDNATFFFFAGWGFGIGNDIALVLGDFGRPNRPLMSSTVSFDNIYGGMSPSFHDEHIARTQFYFVDAGREYFDKAQPYLSSVTQAFNLAPKNLRDTRNAPVFYSSVAGGLPYSRVGGMTIFGEVLLDCLNEKAAEATEEYRDGRRLWRVSVNSLNAALEREFDRLEASQGYAVQSYTLGGNVKDATICFLDRAPKTSTLVFDERTRHGNGPGFHVLIAGVSAYPHGLGGQANTARIHLGVGQLSAAATSGFLLYHWLLENQDRFAMPLLTIRVLLSPTAAEIERTPALSQVGDRCTLQNFLVAAGEWRDDASIDPGNMTLLYFAGHGAQRTKGDSVLLLEDFGEAIGGPLRNAVDVDNIFFGMSPSTARKNIARTQLYFIDACRVRPAAFKNYRLMHTTAIFEIEEMEADDRFAPIFHAAASGSVAYGISDQQTVFSRLLLECFKRTAVRPENGSREGISIRSLDQALQSGMQTWNSEKGAHQEYSLEGLAKDKVFFCWDAKPASG